MPVPHSMIRWTISKTCLLCYVADAIYTDCGLQISKVLLPRLVFTHSGGQLFCSFAAAATTVAQFVWLGMTRAHTRSHISTKSPK